VSAVDRRDGAARQSSVGAVRMRFVFNIDVSSTVSRVGSNIKTGRTVSRGGRFGWATEVGGSVSLNGPVAEVTL